MCDIECGFKEVLVVITPSLYGNPEEGVCDFGDDLE
jgi:hypothetical protein